MTRAARPRDQQADHAEPPGGATPDLRADPRVGRRLDVALALLSTAILTLEILQTKIFAFSLDPVTIFLAVGLCLLGLGAGATALALAPAVPEARLPRLVSALSIAGSITTLAAHGVFARLSPRVLDGGLEPLLILTALTMPYVCFGVVVAAVMMGRAAPVGRTYAVNLGGSALGCLLVFPLLDWLGAERLLVAATALPFVAGLLVWPRGTARTAAAAVGAAVLVVLGWRAPAWLEFQPDPRGQLSMAVDRLRKIQTEHPGSEMVARPLFSRWDQTARIDVWDLDVSVPDYQSRVGQRLPVHFFVQDSSAGSILLAVGRDLTRARPFFEQTVYGAGYVPHPVRDMLIVGLGGAPDVMAALHHGVQHIDAVEINATTIGLVRDVFRAELGEPYQQPGVHLHQADGRTFIRQPGRAYDLIQMSGVDAKSVFASGVLAVNENYLYTREAVGETLRRLAPDGVLAMVRFTDWDVQRLASVAVAALRDAGVATPERNVVALEQGLWRSLLVKRTPFTAVELDRLHAWVAAAGPAGPDIVLPMYDGIGLGLRHPIRFQYSPAPRPVATTPYFQALAAGTLDAFVEAERLDYRPIVDDRPFFFFRERPLNALWDPPWALTMLGTIVAELGAIAIAFILLPLLAFRARGLNAAGAGRVLVYFSCLGAGFMLVEIGLIQRFVLLLGHQSYAVTVVLLGLLVGAGVGSLWSSRLDADSRPWLPFAAIVGVVLAYAVALGHLFLLAAPLPFAWRLALALLLVVGLGLLLGIPFPTALRRVQQTSPQLGAWAIGVNGFASVLGSTAAVPLAMLAGLRAVLLLGLALYVLALVAYPRRA